MGPRGWGFRVWADRLGFRILVRCSAEAGIIGPHSRFECMLLFDMLLRPHSGWPSKQHIYQPHAILRWPNTLKPILSGSSGPKLNSIPFCPTKTASTFLRSMLRSKRALAGSCGPSHPKRHRRLLRRGCFEKRSAGPLNLGVLGGPARLGRVEVAGWWSHGRESSFLCFGRAVATGKQP